MTTTMMMMIAAIRPLIQLSPLMIVIPAKEFGEENIDMFTCGRRFYP